jgi:hypothetical protein
MAIPVNNSQKRQQIQAMKILNDYIRELTNSRTLSVNNLKDAKKI